MTLENCQRLLKHFNNIADGTITGTPAHPNGHKDWADVVANAKVRAAEMERHIEHKKRNIETRMEHNKPEVREKYLKYKKETKPKEKKDVKRPA